MKWFLPAAVLVVTAPLIAQSSQPDTTSASRPTLLNCSDVARNSTHTVVTLSKPTKSGLFQRINRWFEDDVLDKNKGTIKLGDAIAAIQSAVDSAKCANYDPNGRFQLISADMDFQTEKDDDGNLEVLFIGGLAGEKEKQTILDTDFTFTVPIEVNPEKPNSEKLMALQILSGPAKALSIQNHEISAETTDPNDLGIAIANAIAQLNKGFNGLPILSQHQVKVSLKFVFTVDGTIEAEPKIGSVGITAKYKHSDIGTQNLTLTFADSAPTVSISALPSPTVVGKPVSLTVTAVSAANPTAHLSGIVNFILDGNVYMQGGKAVEVQLANGISTDGTITFPAKGTHVISAYLGRTSTYDAATSTPIVIAVQ
jgi:hypothetical protein